MRFISATSESRFSNFVTFSIENDGFQASKANMVQYKVPNDYKFHCFSRFVMANSHKEIDRKIYIQVDTERFNNHSRTIFDDKWEKMPFEICCPAPKIAPQKPQNLSLLLKVAKALSQNFGGIRVDLYSVKSKVIVGELTFTHGGGTEKFNPNKWDKMFGDMWG